MMMAATTTIASSAFVSDISGVCSSGETRLMSFESDEPRQNEHVKVGDRNPKAKFPP